MKKFLLRILQKIKKIKFFKKIIAISLKTFISVIVITILNSAIITAVLATLLDINKTFRTISDLTLPISYQGLALLKMLSQLAALFSSYFAKKVDNSELAANLETSCLFFTSTYLLFGGEFIIAGLYIYSLKKKK